MIPVFKGQEEKEKEKEDKEATVTEIATATASKSESDSSGGSQSWPCLYRVRERYADSRYSSNLWTDGYASPLQVARQV